MWDHGTFPGGENGVAQSRIVPPLVKAQQDIDENKRNDQGGIAKTSDRAASR